MNDQVNRSVDVGSPRWQQGFIQQHTAEMSGYLEQLSRLEAVRRVAACALNLMAPLAGRCVLEVGCGNGVFLPLLASAVGSGGRVVGIDYAAEFVEKARAKVQDAGLAATVTVEQADAYRLPFPASTFDAVHCERVLMHLDDPSAALIEMQRVLRPGGWIVAAEPDWAGFRVDHPDRAAMDLVHARSLQIRQPDMGMTLYRRMGELGLIERRAEALIAVITDFEMMKALGLDLPRGADALVADGVLTRERTHSLLSSLEAANAAGRSYSVVAMHVVAGRVPG